LGGGYFIVNPGSICVKEIYIEQLTVFLRVKTGFKRLSGKGGNLKAYPEGYNK
jgi:hypothetical protein